MHININFEAQVRRAAGQNSTSLDIGDDATIADVVRKLAAESPEPLQRLLVDESGAIRSTVMVFLDDEHVPLTSDRRLGSAAAVTITSPISGG